jgi:hypothetical protein
MSDDSWIESRLGNAAQASSDADRPVNQAVLDEFKALLGNELQDTLKPADLKAVVARLTKAIGLAP